jgi:hypothetical protein
VEPDLLRCVGEGRGCEDGSHGDGDDDCAHSGDSSA